MEIQEPIKIGNFWTNILDDETGESVNFQETETWADGSAMDDSKADGVVYRKLPDGGGYVRRVINNSEYSLDWWGVDNTGNSSATPQLQTAIDLLSSMGGGTLIVSAGDYLITSSIFLRSGVFLRGVSKPRFFTISSGVSPIITSPSVTTQPITQTTDIIAGDTTVVIPNSVPQGAFVRFLSADRFTAAWDNGVEIRPSYVNGELNKVVAAEPSEIEFSKPFYLNFPVATSSSVEWFVPNKNSGIDNFILEHTVVDSAAPTVGLMVRGYDGFTIGSLETVNTEHAGIIVDRSMNVTINNFSGEGGHPDLGLNYGVFFTDGSRDVSVRRIQGVRFRHTSAGGGTGYAVPMFIRVDHVYATESQGHSVDAHGNCAEFSFGSLQVDRGFSVSGRGHSVESCTTDYMERLFSYEGGDGINIGTVIIKSFRRLNQIRALINSNIGVLEAGYNVNSKYGTSWGLQFIGNANNITFGRVAITNLNFIQGGTSADNDDYQNVDMSYGFQLPRQTTIKDLYVRGFYNGVFVRYPDCTIEKLVIDNCGWTSPVNTDPAQIRIHADASRTTIYNTTIINTAPNVSFAASKYIEGLPGAINDGLTIDTLRVQGNRNSALGTSIPVNFENVSLTNVNTLANNNNIVVASGEFLNTNVTLANRPHTRTFSGDLNSLIYPGTFYTATAATNKPIDVNGFVDVFVRPGGMICQVYRPVAGAARGLFFARYDTGTGTFGGWYRYSAIQSGSTRPTANLAVGEQYFDTNLGIPIYYNGVEWVDSSGSSV